MVRNLKGSFKNVKQTVIIYAQDLFDFMQKGSGDKWFLFMSQDLQRTYLL